MESALGPLTLRAPAATRCLQKRRIVQVFLKSQLRHTPTEPSEVGPKAPKTSDEFEIPIAQSRLTVPSSKSCAEPIWIGIVASLGCEFCHESVLKSRTAREEDSREGHATR